MSEEEIAEKLAETPYSEIEEQLDESERVDWNWREWYTADTKWTFRAGFLAALDLVRENGLNSPTEESE